MSQSNVPDWDHLLTFVLGTDEPSTREELWAALNDFGIDLRPSVYRVRQALRSMRAGLARGTSTQSSFDSLLTAEEVDTIVRECAHVRELLSHTPGPIGAVVGTTLRSVIVSWSPEAELLYGYSAAEMTGQTVARLTPTDGLDELSGIMARIHHGEPIAPMRTTRVHKDGRQFIAAIGLCRIRNVQGKQIGALTVAQACATAE